MMVGSELTHLPEEFYSKLNLSRCRCRRRQLTSHACGRPRSIENIGVIRSNRHGKVGVVHDVEKLRPELHVEVFGDFSNAIVLEDRKIKIREAGSDQNIASG